MKDGVRSLIGRMNNGDVVIFFVSSHGMVSHGEQYVCGTDTDPDNIATTALKLNKVGCCYYFHTLGEQE